MPGTYPKKYSLLFKRIDLSLETGKDPKKKSSTARKVSIPCWAVCSEPCQTTLIVTPGRALLRVENFNLSHIQEEKSSFQIYRPICLLDTLSKCYDSFFFRKSAGILKTVFHEFQIVF